MYNSRPSFNSRAQQPQYNPKQIENDIDQVTNGILTAMNQGQFGGLAIAWMDVALINNPSAGAVELDIKRDAFDILMTLLNNNVAYEPALNQCLEVSIGGHLNDYFNVQNRHMLANASYSDMQGFNYLTDKFLSFTRAGQRSAPAVNAGYTSTTNRNMAYNAPRNHNPVRGNQHATQPNRNGGMFSNAPQNRFSSSLSNTTHDVMAASPRAGRQITLNHGNPIQQNQAPQYSYNNNNQQPQQPIGNRVVQVNQPREVAPEEYTYETHRDLAPADVERLTKMGVRFTFPKEKPYPGKMKDMVGYFLTRTSSYAFPYKGSLSVPQSFNPATHYLILGLTANEEVVFEILEKTMHPEASYYAVHIRESFRSAEHVTLTQNNVFKIDGSKLDNAVIFNEAMVNLLEKWESEGKIPAGTTFNGLTETQKQEALNITMHENSEAHRKALAERRSKAVEQGEDPALVKRAFAAVEDKSQTKVTSIKEAVERLQGKYGNATHENAVVNQRSKLISVLRPCKDVAERDRLFDELLPFQRGKLSEKSSVKGVYDYLIDKSLPLPVFEFLNRKVTQIVSESIVPFLGLPQEVATLFTDFAVDYHDFFEDYLERQVEEHVITRPALTEFIAHILRSCKFVTKLTADEVKQAYPHSDDETAYLMSNTYLFIDEDIVVVHVPALSNELQLEPGGNAFPRGKFPLLSELLKDNNVRNATHYLHSLDNQLYKVIRSTFSEFFLQEMPLQ